VNIKARSWGRLNQFVNVGIVRLRTDRVRTSRTLCSRRVPLQEASDASMGVDEVTRSHGWLG
jgi:hypothetical protein